MNAAKLRELIDLLLAKEAASGLQSQMGQVTNSLAQLVASQQQPQFQAQFAATRNQLSQSSHLLLSSIDTQTIPAIIRIGAAPFFLVDFSDTLLKLVSDNPMTPTVAHQQFVQIVGQRQQYLETLVGLRDGLDNIGVRAPVLAENSAEIGFTIPRSLFNDHLEGLIGELGEIKFMLRVFSEIGIGFVEPITVKQISTSDPTFYFQMAMGTVAVVSRMTSAALTAWKQVEEIRKLREEAKRIKNGNEIIAAFDKKIGESLEVSIEEETITFLPQDGTARGNELQNHLRLALRSLFARVERGLIVEVRFVAKSANDGNGQSDRDADAIESLNKSTPNLVFPPASLEPIIPLPRYQDKSGTIESSQSRKDSEQEW